MSGANRILRDQSGGVTLMFGLFFTALMGVTAAALDFSYGSWRRTSLQQAADAGALSGALLETTDEAAVKAEANRLFQANAGLEGVVPTVTVAAETVTVEARYAQPTFLAQVLGHKQIEVSVRAVARRSAQKPACVIALEPTEKHGIVLNSYGKIDADCGTQVNSKNAEALYANSNSMLKSTGTCVTGG